MIKILLIFILFIPFNKLSAQSLPIFLDGKTDDWNIPLPTYIDDIGNGNIFDFRYFSVTNDEQFLFIRLRITPEFKLVEDNFISLYIDGDNNIGTGIVVNGIGAELKWDFGFRNGEFYKNGTTQIGFSDIQYRSLPTVTDTTYEIAIGRNVQPNGSDPLFTSSTIKIFFKDNVSNGDWMPNSGEVFNYTFDETPTPPVNLIEINKENTSLLRIMNYNVLQDGLLNPNREEYFARILQAIQPDIICFNEFSNSSASQVKNKMNQILPLPNSQSWNAMKLDYDDVVVSKFPISQGWTYDPAGRSFASLIDLPEYYGTDVLTINAHLKCCGGPENDDKRQRQVDAIISFLLDAKTPGGSIELPQDTPFIILGDLNLVGDRQQLTTLITGEIINTQLFGNGGPPDWDETDLEDLISQQTDKRTAYTWRNDNSSFPPGILDFQIYSNSVISVEKSFVIQTEIMSADRLTQYGLQQFDTRNASDHFPKVTDYSFTITSIASEDFQPTDFILEQNFPNPFNPTTIIRFTIPQSIILIEARNRINVQLKVYDVLGTEVAALVNKELPAGNYEVNFNATNISSGVYFYRLQAGSFVSSKMMLLLK